MSGTSGMRIERGARVLATDGEVGRVTHVVVDHQTREVTEIVVDSGGQELLIPATAVTNAGGNTVRLQGTRAQLAANRFDRDQFHALDDERAEAESAQQAVRGGAPLKAASDDEVVVGGTRQAPAQPARAARPTEEIAVPVAEERLHVEKRRAELGELLVRKRVVQEQVSVPVELTREEVHVAQRDIADRPVQPGDQVFQEGTIRVPVRGEQAIVEKEAVVTGEVVIDKDRVVEREQVTDTVRREQVEVEERVARPDESTRRRTDGTIR